MKPGRSHRTFIDRSKYERQLEQMMHDARPVRATRASPSLSRIVISLARSSSLILPRAARISCNARVFFLFPFPRARAKRPLLRSPRPRRSRQRRRSAAAAALAGCRCAPRCLKVSHYFGPKKCCTQHLCAATVRSSCAQQLCAARVRKHSPRPFEKIAQSKF